MVYWVAENIGLAWVSTELVLETEPGQFVVLCICHVYISVNTNSTCKEVTRRCGWQNGKQLISVASTQWETVLCRCHCVSAPVCPPTVHSSETLRLLPDSVENVGEAGRLTGFSLVNLH